MLDPLFRFLHTTPLTDASLPAFLDCLHSVFGTNGAHLLSFTTEEDSRILSSSTHGLPDSIGRDYARHYHRINPRILTPLPNAEVLVDSSYLDREAFRRTEFYDWYSREAQSSELMIFQFDLTGKDPSMLTIGRDIRFGYFDEADLLTAGEVYTALRTNLALSGAIGSSWPFAETLLQEIDPASAIVLLAPGSRIIGASETAQMLIAGCADLSCFHDELRGQRSAAGLEAACSQASRTGAPQKIMVSGGPAADPGLEISIVPLPRPALSIRPAPLLLHIRVRPDSRKEEAVTKLSPAELALCRLVVDGHSLRQISEIRRVSYNTSRKQLARAHEKLGTQSIPDIIREFGTFLKARQDSDGKATQG